jgi:glycosyltransferase involved in cell wall biosynthesis
VHPPLVSVVLLTHNRPGWLSGSLSSVLRGSFEDFEVVVSNNGDPEDTRRLQSTIVDTRIRWVEQDRDSEQLENMLAGLRLARGRYVAVLHDDDWWSPDFLSALVPPLERDPEVVLSFADHYIVDQSGDVQEAQSDANSERWGRCDLSAGIHQPFFHVVARQCVAITGCVFRRAALALDEFTPDVGVFDDIWMSYQLAKTGGAAYFVDRRLMYYRSHDGSHTAGGHLSTRLNAIWCRTAMLQDPDLSAYRPLVATRLARDHLSAGAELLRCGQRGRARSHLADSVRLRPTVKALAGWFMSWVAPCSVLARL